MKLERFFEDHGKEPATNLLSDPPIKMNIVEQLLWRIRPYANWRLQKGQERGLREVEGLIRDMGKKPD